MDIIYKKETNRINDENIETEEQFIKTKNYNQITTKVTSFTMVCKEYRDFTFCSDITYEKNITIDSSTLIYIYIYIYQIITLLNWQIIP